MDRRPTSRWRGVFIWAAGGWDVETLLVGFSRGKLGDQVVLAFAFANLVQAGLSLLPYRTAGRFTDGFSLLLTGASIASGPETIAELTAATHYPAEIPAKVRDAVCAIPLRRPEGADTRLLQARLFMESDRYLEAYEAARASQWNCGPEVAAFLDEVIASAILGLDETSRYPEADAASGRALAHNPDDPKCRHTRGWFLVKAGRPQEGLSMLWQTMRASGLTTQQRRVQTWLFIQAGRYREAFTAAYAPRSDDKPDLAADLDNDAAMAVLYSQDASRRRPSACWTTRNASTRGAGCSIASEEASERGTGTRVRAGRRRSAD